MSSSIFSADPEKNRVLYRQFIDLGREAARAGSDPDYIRATCRFLHDAFRGLPGFEDLFFEQVVADVYQTAL